MTVLRVLIVAAIVGLPSIAGVDVEHDLEVDFTRYRTYAWKPGTAAVRPEVQGWIVAAVERELGAKGLRAVADGRADLYVVTHVFKELDSRTLGNYYHLHRRNLGVITSDVVATSKGVLIVDLIDGESGRSIWQGMASDVMALPSSTKLRKKIERAARRLFRDFPPQLEGKPARNGAARPAPHS